MKINLKKRILSSNQETALENRKRLDENNVLCFNVISSPGSGKTTILARTITDLKNKFKIGVIEGDIKTDTDAKKIQQTGAAAIQIETQGACHLSAQQVGYALTGLKLDELDFIFIENVGNLVCPASFELGEHARVIVLSVPEGDDKPLKYPGTFATADVILINKIDLAEYIEFNAEKVIADIRAVNPDAQIFQVSAKTGTGMDKWYEWLGRGQEGKRHEARGTTR